MQRFFGAGSAASSGVPPLPSTFTAVRFWASARGYPYQDSGFATPATVDAAPVGGLRGYGGAGWDGTQATAGQRPTLALTGLSGHRALLFDPASTQFLDWGNLAVCEFERTDPFTLYLALYLNSTASTAREIISKWNSSNVGWHLRVFGNNGVVNFGVQDATASQNRVGLASGAFPVNAPAILAARNGGSGTASDMVVFINGVKMTMSTLNDTCRATIKGGGPLQLGAFNGALTFSGYVGEAVACAAAHVDNDVLANMSYLNGLGYAAY